MYYFILHSTGTLNKIWGVTHLSLFVLIPCYMTILHVCVLSFLGTELLLHFVTCERCFISWAAGETRTSLVCCCVVNCVCTLQWHVVANMQKNIQEVDLIKLLFLPKYLKCTNLFWFFIRMHFVQYTYTPENLHSWV